ncbi:response regulator [Costertonia aggregata]|uniref:Response regulator transcription factor n=1 Tax=Costertonia aggregata TaxID=343403 RepID=A0A7H9ANW6_9FLAO|nr:hypothetical protein [Costertonia aggregata]QLG45117.1 hypothetical protein HYG79_07055 [Costertonia aggregata]
MSLSSKNAHIDKTSILIVEDEPLLCDAYRLVFENISNNTSFSNFDLDIYNDFSSAKEAILGVDDDLHLVILDIRLRSGDYLAGNSGEGLGILLRKNLPKTKIIVVTSLTSNHRLHMILKYINPEGLLIKSEIDFISIQNDIVAVLKGNNVYSQTTIDFFKQDVGVKLNLDDIDRKILYLLSKGVKVNKLTNYVPLTTSGIEARKRRIAKVFNMNKPSIADLLHASKQKGII